jgi:mRNA interferase RelE/StbE
MASFSIQWRASTRKDLRKLPSRQIQRILAEVESLAEEPFPHGSEKLTGAQHTHRIRVGDYRVVYEVLAQSKIVEIQRVRHRKDVYRK